MIRTFPESFAAGKSSIPNNLVGLRAARLKAMTSLVT